MSHVSRRRHLNPYFGISGTGFIAATALATTLLATVALPIWPTGRYEYTGKWVEYKPRPGRTVDGVVDNSGETLNGIVADRYPNAPFNALKSVIVERNNLNPDYINDPVAIDLPDSADVAKYGLKLIRRPLFWQR